MAGINIVNVYKPPSVKWTDDPLPIVPHPALYVGDFNSHNTLWGYQSNDFNGNKLTEWMEVNHYELIFDIKDRGTFRSGRWQRDYSPDLSFVSRNELSETDIASRYVLDDFVHSQHRPVLIVYGLKIPLVQSIPKPRWNFRRAKWIAFERELDSLLHTRNLPPTADNYDEFVKLIKKAASKHIPRGFRKEYIPTWDENCSKLFEEFHETANEETANELLKSLNLNRGKRWKELTADLNFTHSSRKAWTLLRKLGTAPSINRHSSHITPNAVASRLLKLSKAPMDRKRLKSVRNQARKVKRNLRPNDNFSKPFTTAELNHAIKSLKTNKASGYDGMYNSSSIAVPRQELGYWSFSTTS